MKQHQHGPRVELFFQVQQFYLSDCVGECSKLYDFQVDQEITSSTIIRFETDNPVERPLPSWDILELQWLLHRITAMSGASEEYEDDCDDDGYWGKHLLVYGRQCIGWVRVALIFFFFFATFRLII